MIKVQYWNPVNKTVVTESGFRYLNTTSKIHRIEDWEGSRIDIFNRKMILIPIP